MKKIQIEKREVIIWSFIIFFGISPVFAWALNSQIQTAFSNLNIAFVSFGQISGLIGVAFFSLSLILSARLKFIEHLFWGLNKVYDKHHKIGVYSLCLILLHPVFLGIGRYIPFGFPISTDTFKSFLLFFIPQENWTVNLGIAAINFFLTLMILTLFVKSTTLCQEHRV